MMKMWILILEEQRDHMIKVMLPILLILKIWVRNDGARVKLLSQLSHVTHLHPHKRHNV